MNEAGSVTSTFMRRVRVAAAIAFAGLAAAATAQDKDAWPARPIRFYVCCAPGGSADLVSRLLAAKLTERLGQPIVVENRVGGGGLLANDLVAKAPPDGYSWILLTGGHPVSGAVMNKMPYDPVDGFGFVTTVTAYPFLVSVPASSEIKSLPDFIARAKANPGKMTAAVGTIASLHHLLGELLGLESKTEFLVVPLKGAGQSVVEVMSGRIDIMIETATATIGYIKSGKLRGLAQTTATRSPLMPDIPAMAETLPGFDVTSWLGLAVAPRTPRPIIDLLNREVRTVIEMPDVRQRLAELGGVPTPSTPDEMRERVIRETERWKRVVELKGVPKQ